MNQLTHVTILIFQSDLLFTFFFSDLHITIVKRLRTISVLEGEYCSFECTLSHDIIDEPSWTLNGQLIISNGRIQFATQGRKYAMNIQEVMTTDAGEVVFTIKDLSCRTLLFVKGILNILILKRIHCLG